MATFNFPDGRWVRLRPMYVLDELAFDDLAATGEEMEAARAGLATAGETLEAAKDGDDAAKSAAIDEAAGRFEEWQRAYSRQLRAVYARLSDATEATSWDGELGARVTSEELAQLSRRWRHASEDETLPPV